MYKTSMTSWKRINMHQMHQRIIKLEIELSRRKILTLGVYGPTDDRPQRRRKQFRKEVQELIDKVTQDLILRTHINRRFGTGKQQNGQMMARYGEQNTNGNGQKLTEICEK